MIALYRLSSIPCKLFAYISDAETLDESHWFAIVKKVFLSVLGAFNLLSSCLENVLKRLLLLLLVIHIHFVINRCHTSLKNLRIFNKFLLRTYTSDRCLSTFR